MENKASRIMFRLSFIYVDHQKKRTYPVSSRNMIYLKIVTELKTKFHLYMCKIRLSSSSSRTWHTAAVVSKELISRNSSFRGWCEMVLHSFVFDLLFQSAKDSPGQNFFCHLFANLTYLSVPLFPPPFHPSTFTNTKLTNRTTIVIFFFSCFHETK